MNTRFFLLIAILLPLFLGISPGLSGKALSPVASFNCTAPEPGQIYASPQRDRFFRLLEILREKDWGQTGNDVNDFEQIFVYQSETSTQLDSVSFCYWNSQLDPEAWDYYFRRSFVYDPTQSYVTEIDTYYEGYTEPMNKQVFQYDGQNRLTSILVYQINDNFIGYYLTRTHFFTYTGSYLSQYVIKVLTDPDNHYHYEKYLLTNDAPGRITSSLHSESSDSLTWTIDHLENLTYAADDQTTAADVCQAVIARFQSGRQEWPQFDLGLASVLGNIGKLSQDITDYSWNGSTFSNHLRFTWYYDAQERPDYILLQSPVGSDWLNISKFTYAYDATGGWLSLCAVYHWDNGSGDWYPPYELEFYYYQEITGSDDEVIPSPALQLSAWPNPFSGSVAFSLQTRSLLPVQAEVCNIRGQLVRTLDSKSNSFVWDGKDSAGRSVANGIYFVRVHQGGTTLSRKLVRLN
jgi:hypothetical protein